MNDNWYKDIMTQKFQFDNYYDPTKLFIVLAMTECGILKQKYHIKEIAQYVYRLYVANLDISSKNFNIIIRNIGKYGIEDICPFIANVISQWVKEQKYNSLVFNNDVVTLNIEDYTESSLMMTRKICLALFQKYYKKALNKIEDYNFVAEMDDTNLDEFGKCSIKKLIFEDIQYCPFTEITDQNQLYAVHILSKKETENLNDLIDKDNLLIMSRDYAQEYIEGKFCFDEFGRVININSNIVNKRMRLSIHLMTNKRKEYIKKHYLKLFE